MSDVKKVYVFNLLILLVYSVLLVSSNLSGGSDAEMSVGLGMLMLVVAQVVINVIVAIIMFILKKKKLGLAFLLSSLVVLVIGLSACLGGVTLVGELN